MSARTVLHSNGRPYRVLLTQPPSYRRGTDPVPAIDAVTRAAETALRNAKERRDRALSAPQPALI